MIKKFKEYINEGVRDKMTPVSKEDILKNLKGKPFNYIAHNLELQGLNIKDFFTKEEIKSSLKGEPFFYITYNLEIQDLNINDFFTKEEIDKMDKMTFSYIDDDQEVIFIDMKRMKDVLSVVGEGVDDIIVQSISYSYNEYQNEVYVIFSDNAWGGISLKEWNRLDEILKGLVKKNGLDYFDIYTEGAKVLLKFDSKYPLEEI